MKKIFFSVLLCVLALSMSAQKCAVLEFRGSASVSVSAVDGITEMFMTYFQPAGYTMIERAQIEKVITEQHFQRSNITDSQAVRLGKILNASVVIVGKVSGLDGYQVDVRAVDVQSGHDLAFEGASFGGDFREDVRNLAIELAAKIAIRPVTTVQPTPSKPVQSTTPKAARKNVDVLYGYLKVFPKELGKFPFEPVTIIKRINQQAQYGYNNWRLPTKEEKALLRAENYLNEDEQYMTHESRNEEGIVLLVSDGEDFTTIKRAEKARQDSIAAAIEKARQDSIAEANRIAEEARIAAAIEKARQDSIAEAKRLAEEARIAAAKEKARQDSIAEAVRIVAAKEKARQDSIAAVARAKARQDSIRVVRRLNVLQDSIAKARDYKYQKRNRELEEQGWCELGLPSGTLWRFEDEKGFYSHSEAINAFGAQLPSKAQWEELKTHCEVHRGFESGPFKVTGPKRHISFFGHFNNNFVAIQNGGNACYWSSSLQGNNQGWAGIISHVVEYSSYDCKGCNMIASIQLHSDDLNIKAVPVSTKLSVRLVKQDIPFGYVDLGLPSGTLWKDQNEDGGFYTYEQAIEKFGNNLPTEEQFVELVTSCQWSWIGCAYKVTGPNGESIILPAAGYNDCDGSVNYVGSDGDYWSSTPTGSEDAWRLYFYSSEVGMGNNYRCSGQSVRLVH